jgi:hypothetical protein
VRFHARHLCPEAVDHSLLLLDRLDENSAQLVVGERLVAIIVGMHQLGKHLFDVLGDATDLGTFGEVAVGEFGAFPSEKHAIGLDDEKIAKATEMSINLY